jgi:uncharacterized protein (TIGR00290 family)
MTAMIAWSSGKDCAVALHHARHVSGLTVSTALTTLTEPFERVSMHGVRRALLDAQLDAASLASLIVPIPYPCANEVYEQRMGAALDTARRAGITQIIFGDLFVEDIRAYREQKLAGTGITPLFPLWGTPTAMLARDISASGVEAYLVCIDRAKLPDEFCGRRYDMALLDALPRDVDPCGENGEFHTCVVGGPMLSRRIPVVVGERVIRDGFTFCDLAPADGDALASRI